MLTAIIVVLLILACLALILLTLMHSGMGGGLSDMFGGSMGSAAAGAPGEAKTLDRRPVAVAVVGGVTRCAPTRPRAQVGRRVGSPARHGRPCGRLSSICSGASAHTVAPAASACSVNRASKRSRITMKAKGSGHRLVNLWRPK